MRLTAEQSDYLKRLGQSLSPVVSIGAGGLTKSVIKQIDAALDRDELIKVKVPYGRRARRDEVLYELAPTCGASLIERVGDAALLYRRAAKPIIVLPSH